MINKYELIGIFTSVALMAMALFLLRVETTTFGQADVDFENQAASVVVVGGTDDSRQQLQESLVDSLDATGKVSKMVIDDVLVGSGEMVEDGDTVSVHYIGTLENGQEFDNSYKRGEAFEFKVGAGKVIEGWELGLVGMKVGGKRILVVPADMAYGNQNVGPIPANSTLIFAIELIAVK